MLAAHFRFCPACGHAAPPLPDYTDGGRGAPRGAGFEAALLRTLRDVEDEHLGLWGEIGAISCDRVIPSTLGDVQDWVGVMLARGWVVPDRRGYARLTITPTGRVALADRATQSSEKGLL